MTLPSIVYQMCVNGALVVGSYAKLLAGDNVDPNDFDLLVPYEHWPVIVLLIPKHARLNSFGGWRFTVEYADGVPVEVDVWPGSLEKYLSECKTKHGGKVHAVDYIHNKVYSVEPLSAT